MTEIQRKKGVALVKIAPGRRAKFWPECLAGGYICVGWDEVGNLRQYRSKLEFQRTFERKYKRSEYHGRLSLTRRKANELWTLTKLKHGDKIVANKGIKQVLAVGTVQKQEYRWRPSKRRGGHFHTVKVKWDTSFAKKIAPQPWNQTVAEVSYRVFKTIAGSHAPPPESIRLLSDDANAPKTVSSNETGTTTSRSESKIIQTVEHGIEQRAGFQPNPEIRRAVEAHAMARAVKEFEARGYTVIDVSRQKSFDLLCAKNGKNKYVEVKGSQGNGLEVALTAGEVRFIKKHGSNCVLCVVHGIDVESSKRAKASGGQMTLDEPLDLSRGELSPIAFTYRRRR